MNIISFEENFLNNAFLFFIQYVEAKPNFSK